MAVEDRAKILVEAFAPGEVVSSALRFRRGLICTWRRQALAKEADPEFVPDRLVNFRARWGRTGHVSGLPERRAGENCPAAPSELAVELMRALK